MTANSLLAELRAAAPTVLPSILQCDFGSLAEELRRLETTGVRALHLDVMDGHFVPNLSFGLPVVAAIRRLTELPLDVHLMISNPGEYAARYIEAGADVVTVHAEVLDDPSDVLQEIRELGAGAGLAINPPTPIDPVVGVAEHCDLVLVMSVMPGFGGQQFDEIAIEKLRAVRAEIPANVLLEVDGGVNEQTIAACADAGAQLMVVGSAITGQEDYSASVDRLVRLATAD